MMARHDDRPVTLTHDAWVRTNWRTLCAVAGLLVCVTAMVVTDRMSISARFDAQERALRVIARCTLDFQKSWYEEKGLRVPASLIDARAELDDAGRSSKHN